MGLFDLILNRIFTVFNSAEPPVVHRVSSHEQTSPRTTSPPLAQKTETYSDNSKRSQFVKIRRSYRTGSGATFVPLWQKAGWVINAQNPNYSIGHYKFYNKKHNEILQWEGAVRSGPYEAKVYIKNPPSFLKSHKHWGCFMHQGDGWYLVHFLKRINGLDDAILNVQRLITEAFWFC
ncbi:MAG: hypothetical protein KKE62_01680 [Proteobacteria bacterium]|nr:hypothetical protein [Pseudomonadota bacterium]MBU1387152.1 hypothetical protein [Pseudomonadota bacterium]MBU1541531.1 hypothetical protein [Pseudomonadota bacterium]